MNKKHPGMKQKKPRKPKLNPRKLAKINLSLEQARRLRVAGHLDQAIHLYRELIAQYPDFADTWFQLGSLYLQAKKFNPAFEHLSRAIELAPKEKSYWYDFMLSCQSASRLPELETALRMLLSFNPDSVHNVFNLGICLKKQNKSLEAIEVLKKGLAIEPDNVVARTTLALALLDIGEEDEARTILSEVIQDDPNNVIALRQLTMITKHRDYSDNIKRMEQLFYHDLADNDRSLLGFAIAKAFEDLGDSERCFSYLDKANALKRSTFEYSTAETTNQFAEIRSVFTKEFIDQFPKIETENPTPVFVIGMPRSGTSLVEQILASHSYVYGAGELQYLSRNCIDLSNSLSIPFPEIFRKAEIGQLQQLGRDYLSTLGGLSDGSPMVVDKLPHNFIYAGVILCLFDNAKIIHCVRNPVATCYSIYKHSFGGHHRYAYDQQELGRYYRLYEALMSHWLAVAPAQIHTVEYEKLVANSAEETENLLRYCGLQTEAACLVFHQTRRVVGTVSNTQVRQPIYSDAVLGWKRYERFLAPLLASLSNSAAPINGTSG